MNVMAIDLGTEVISVVVGKLKGNDMVVKGHAESYIMDPTIMDRGNVKYVKGVSNVLKSTVKRALSEAKITMDQVKGVGLSMTGDKFNMVETEVQIGSSDELSVDDIGYALTDFINPEPDNWPVSVDVLDVEVDGTSVDPRELGLPYPEGLLGVRVSSLNIRAVISYTKLGIHNNLERIARLLNSRLITISVEPLAVAKALREYKIEDCLLIDSGGGTTDISVVQNSFVETCESIKVGGRDFTLSIANDLGLTYDEAEEVKKKINSPIADKVLNRFGLTREQVLECIEEVADYVKDIVKSAIKGIIREMNIEAPERVELYGGNTLLDQAETAIREAVMDAYRDYLGMIPHVEMLEANRIPHIGKQLTGPMRVVSISVLKDTLLSVHCGGKKVRVEIDELRAPEGRYVLEASGVVEDVAKIPQRGNLKETLINFLKEILLMESAGSVVELTAEAYAGTVKLDFEGMDTANVDGVRITVEGSRTFDDVDRFPKEYKILQVKEMGPILLPVDEFQAVEGGVGETASDVGGVERGLDDTGSDQAGQEGT